MSKKFVVLLALLLLVVAFQLGCNNTCGDCSDGSCASAATCTGKLPGAICDDDPNNPKRCYVVQHCNEGDPDSRPCCGCAPADME